MAGAVLASAGCGPEDAMDESTRVAAAREALLPPQSICTTHPNLCTPLPISNPHPALSRGWNLISDQDTPSLLSCLEPPTVSAQTLNGARVTTSVKFVSDVTDVKDTLQLDARIAGGLPQASIPVSGSLFGDVGRTTTAKSTAIQLLVHTRVEYAPQRITSVPRLTAGALQRFDTNGAVAFRDLCGDRYVEQVTMGASFYAVVKLSSNVTSVQSHLRANLLANVSNGDAPDQAVKKALEAVNAGGSISANGSVTGSFNNTAVEVSIELQQLGGPVANNPLSVPDLLERLRTFPTSITTVSQLVPMGMTLKPYAQSANFGTRQVFAMGDASTSLTRVLGPAYAAYFDAYQELDFALSHSSSLFFPFNASTAAALMDECAVKLLDIESLIERCGAGEACTEAQMRSAIGTSWQTLRSRLPLRKQLFKVTGKAFMEQAQLRGALSTATAEGFAGNMEPCVLDINETAATTTLRNSVRMFSRAALPGTSSCRYRLFNNGSLRAPWNIEAIDADLTESTITRMPTATNLRLDVTQRAQPWHWPVSYVKTLTLAGPEEQSPDAWRAAVQGP